MNRALAAVVAGALLALAGCGASGPDRTVTFPSEGPISASNPVVPTATPAPWVQITDRPSGIRFDFPHKRKPTSPKKGERSTRIYQMAIPDGNLNGDKLTVAMAFFDQAVPGLAATLDTLVASAKRAGMSDAKASPLRTTKFAGGEGQTGTITFTDATDLKGFWLVTEFAAGSHTVTAQVYSLSTAAELPARQQRVKQLMHQLLTGIKLA